MHQPGWENRWKVRKRDTQAIWVAWIDEEGFYRVTANDGLVPSKTEPPRFDKAEFDSLFEEAEDE